MTSSKNARPTLVAAELKSTMRSIEAAYPDQAHRIWEIWETSVDAPLSSRCRPQAYRMGTLVLEVDSPAWMQQVQYLVETIRDTLNQALGGELIRHVRLRIAEATAPPSPAGADSLPPNSQLPPLPDDEKHFMEQELAAIPDPEVRGAVRSARSRAARLALLKGDPEG